MRWTSWTSSQRPTRRRECRVRAFPKLARQRLTRRHVSSVTHPRVFHWHVHHPPCHRLYGESDPSFSMRPVRCATDSTGRVTYPLACILCAACCATDSMVGSDLSFACVPALLKGRSPLLRVLSVEWLPSTRSSLSLRHQTTHHHAPPLAHGPHAGHALVGAVVGARRLRPAEAVVADSQRGQPPS